MDEQASTAEKHPARPLSHFLAMLVLSILLPATALTAGLIWRVGALDRVRADQQALQLARSVTGDLDREMESSIETLRALASSPLLRENKLDAFYRQAADVVSVRKLHVLLRKVDGQQVLNTRVPWGSDIPAQSLSDTDREVIATRQPRISNLVIGAIAQRWVIGLSVPVLIDDEVRYILTKSIEPDHIQRIVAQSAIPAPDWVLAVSDRTGRIIVRTRDQAAYLGREMHPDVQTGSRDREGVHRTPNLEGHEVLRGYKWSDKSGWIVAAFVPSHIVDGPLRNMWRLFAMTATAVTALALSLAYVISNRLIAQIAEAAKAADRLGRGEVVQPQPSGLVEADKLSFAVAAASREIHEKARRLAENEARYRSVFEQSAVGFSQIALDGQLIGVNDWLCKLLGYSREECLEKSFRVLTYPDDLTDEDALVESLLKGDTSHYEIEKRVITKAGAPIWVRVTSAAVRDDAGKPLYRTSVVEDVTERRAAREAAAQLAAIVQASTDAMMSTDLAGRIENWNPGAEKLFGYSSVEMVGRSLSHLSPIGREDGVQANIAAVNRGETIHAEVVRRHKNDALIDVSVTKTPIRTHGKITSISVTMEDIRDRKKREAHVLLLNRELAHRVKNTLAVIQSIANQTMRSSPNPEAFRMAFQGRLQALSAANDLLTQTEWGGAELKDFVDRQLAPLMPRNSMQLRKDGPAVTIPAELSIHLGLALHELGTNAIKHGAWSLPGGQVWLTWELRQTSDSDEHRLSLTWSEHNGPTVQEPSHRGFGTTLIDRGIPGAKVDRQYLPGGLVCKIDLPLPTIRPSYLG